MKEPSTDEEVQCLLSSSDLPTLIAAQRRSETHDIEVKLADLKEIQEDLSKMMILQGNDLDDLEDNITLSSEDIKKAVKALSINEDYKRSNMSTSILVSGSLLLFVGIGCVASYLLRPDSKTNIKP